MRGFFVFLGCSFLVITYLVVKFVCSRRRGRYSKVARGEDVDMLPLTVPPADDEDDDEIFSADVMRR